MNLDNNSKILENKIKLLIQYSGTLILSIGDYYVQFAKDDNSDEIYFEAVSHYFLDFLPKSIINDFNDLGFGLNEEENYSKTIKVEDCSRIISDVHKIFNDIYKVNYEKSFEIIDDIEYSNKLKEEQLTNESVLSGRNTVEKNRPNFSIIFLGVGILLFIYFVFIKKDKELFSQETYQEKHIEKYPELQLAIINDNTKTPSESTKSSFNDLLNSLSNRYAGISKQEIANTLVSAYNIAAKNGRPETLLEFTIQFNSYSNEVDIRYNISISENIVLFLKFAYEI